MMSSCLSPQTVDPEPTVGRLPPVIEYSGISPSTAYVCLDNTNVSTSNFTMTVVSTDGKSLTAQWYIDYDPSLSTTQNPNDALDQVPLGGINILHWSFNATGLNLIKPGPHSLEAVVATNFATGDAGTTNQWPNRVIGSGDYAVTYKWVINWLGSEGTCQ